MFVYNSKLLLEETLTLSPHSSSLGYGLSLFETIKLNKGKPEFLSAHLERINHSLTVFGSEKKLTITTVQKDIQKLLNAAKVEEGAIKLMVIDLGEGDHVLLTYRPQKYKSALYHQGFSLGFSEAVNDEKNQFTYHKTANYGSKMIEFRGGKEKGYDDVLFLNTKGWITEGAVTNIFFLKDDSVYTPSLESGLLPGIMRQMVKEVLLNMGKKVVETPIEKNFYRHCQSAWVTNSLMGAMPVRRIEEMDYTVTENHLTTAINAQLTDLIQSRV
ncbi:aminotransferase class IV [Tindallia californiensis]|uniref:4-amino-4-deoxychorismate lyase n=1 Tax=Tindallia californiensis TaxID=159292 RepID=A0A1H3QHS4_9FIRM|nr:aminotransferase class IV [Tindallia californiensis]SDZ12907.1 4-amino-4-deoxychorismate lyase [Tindallia californiensis]